MSKPTSKEVKAVVQIISVIAECIESAGSMGVPEGHLYALLMPTGCSLEQFQQLVTVLTSSGRVKKQGHLLLAA
jgi:hypothetical protein